jgi:putative flippase GtrA
MIQKLLGHTFVRYLIVGVVSVVIDYGSLMVGYHVFGLHLGVATTVAFLLGLVGNFFMTKFWTFGGNGATHTAKQSTRQVILVAMLVCFNLVVTNVVIAQLNKVHIGPEISKLVTTAIVTLWNYVLYRKVIFKRDIPVAESTYIPEDRT